MICSACSRPMDGNIRFCSGCGRAVDGEAYIREQRRLTRPRQARVIAGVCAGFAQYFGWDVTLVRLVLCCAAFFSLGTPVFAYFIAWGVMPNSPYALPMQPLSNTEAQTGATAS